MKHIGQLDEEQLGRKVVALSREIFILTRPGPQSSRSATWEIYRNDGGRNHFLNRKFLTRA